METIKKLWSAFGQGVSVAFVVATLMAESNNVLTGLFFIVHRCGIVHRFKDVRRTEEMKTPKTLSNHYATEVQQSD